jgi:hypothetical protein
MREIRLNGVWEPRAVNFMDVNGWPCDLGKSDAELMKQLTEDNAGAMGGSIAIFDSAEKPLPARSSRKLSR